MSKFSRPVLSLLLRRLRAPRRFLQVLSGPRQVGKTTLARQALAALDRPHVYASADGVLGEERSWIATQWTRARLLANHAPSGGALLVLDEVQKVGGWSEEVKRLWDEDTARRARLRVLILGSSPLLMGRGLTESLAGRFEVIRATHWAFAEMRDAFGWDLPRYLRFGGYPGSASLVRDPQRWRQYILDSLVETTVSRDILLMTRVDKPALLRRLFELACTGSGQIVAYTKLLGQLHDAGNTTTLAHYLDLLEGAGLVAGLAKHSGARLRQRASSPKLLALNTALVTAVTGRVQPLDDAAAEAAWQGRLLESSLGAHLHASSAGTPVTVGYWRAGDLEVDYVLSQPGLVVGLEVKSGSRPPRPSGLVAFQSAHPGARTLIVGTGGIPAQEFLLEPAATWLEA